MISNLDIFARFFPKDKRILVGYLKRLSETVVVIENDINDEPALKVADIKFFIKIAGTEVAKKASKFILINNNFASIVKAII